MNHSIQVYHFALCGTYLSHRSSGSQSHMKLKVHTEKVHIHVYPNAVAIIHRNFKCKTAKNGQLHQLLLTTKTENKITIKYH